MLKKYVHKLLTTPPDVSKSSVPRKQKPHRRPFSFTLLQGKEMTPFGCHTAVSVIQGNGGETPAVVQRKRVLLPSVPPHSTWKTHPSKFEEIVKERKIITPLTSVARRRKGSVSTPQGLAPLVCPHAASGACRRCPWMAVTKDGGSSREKLDLLHRTVHASGIGRSHSVPLELLPPYTVKAGLHQQQEVLLRYDPGPSHTEEGRFRLPPAADLPRCLLLSLEQKRLSLCLTTWASTLPTSARQALRGAFVCQSPHSQLSVTVWMEKDVHFTGQQSPLCGPSHPADVLSVEEQKLIDAVLQAAPLVREVAVDVCFIEEGTAERLHPSLQRSLSLTEYVQADPSRTVHVAWLAGETTLTIPHAHSTLQHTAHTGSTTLSDLTLLLNAFFRQGGSLEECVSVLMTSLLEEEPFTDQYHRQRQQMWWLLSSEYSADDQDTVFRQILKRYTPLTATHLPAITGLSHCEGGRLQLQGVLHRLLEHCCPHTSVTTGNTPPEMAIQETREHVAILLLSKDENENKRTFLRFAQRVSKKKNPQHFQSVKLMLVELTTDVDRLHATESCLKGLKDGHFFKLPKKGDTPTEGGRGPQTLSAGVVDVDPLSAAFLSYVTVTLAV